VPNFGPTAPRRYILKPHQPNIVACPLEPDLARRGPPPDQPPTASRQSLTVNGPMTRTDRVATLEKAKTQFQKSWDALKAWAKLEEVAGES
jgi:hypothetical protein